MFKFFFTISLRDLHVKPLTVVCTFVSLMHGTVSNDRNKTFKSLEI